MYKVVFVISPHDQELPDVLFEEKEEAEIYKAEHPLCKYAAVIDCGSSLGSFE